MSQKRIGAEYLGSNCCHFKVWAPFAEQLDVCIVSPNEQIHKLARDKRGYYQGTIEGVKPGTLYFYLLDKKIKRPDPASKYQPQGVHGPSQLIDNHNSYAWTDSCWFGLPLSKLVIYELHTGTFTPEGTFKAIIPYLDELKELGITAVELMPVAQFPGSRNWGYDGVYPFAVHNSYGGPEGLKHFVNTCHEKGLAVILDLVYNHLGPEGNYLVDFGPYFTEQYLSPWGASVNFDGPGSDEVRRYFMENALYWMQDFHIDGFRLDAVHAIKDFSAHPFLKELSDAVHREAEKIGRQVHVIAESDLNDARLIQPQAVGGYGLDAQWCDDFHHSLHVLLTGEKNGYYQDFGRLKHLSLAFRQGYVYTGQYSDYRKRRHGNSPALCPARQFIVFAQNHDQVGNRARGERLSSLTSFDGLKLAACTVLLSPYVPLLFMGEEYGETAPFLYFTSHTDQDLARAVRQGRREEFSTFVWRGEVPDPQDEETFKRSRLNRALRLRGHHKVLNRLYKKLLQLRRRLPALQDLNKENLETSTDQNEQVLIIQRWSGCCRLYIILSFCSAEEKITLPLPAGSWEKILDTMETQWLGSGSHLPKEIISTGVYTFTLLPFACILFQKKED